MVPVPKPCGISTGYCVTNCAKAFNPTLDSSADVTHQPIPFCPGQFDPVCEIPHAAMQTRLENNELRLDPRQQRGLFIAINTRQLLVEGDRYRAFGTDFRQEFGSLLFSGCSIE